MSTCSLPSTACPSGDAGQVAVCVASGPDIQRPSAPTWTAAPQWSHVPSRVMHRKVAQR